VILDWVVSEPGGDKALNKAFPDTWRQALLPSCYIASQGDSLISCKPWSKNHDHPCEASLTIQRISDTLKGLSANSRTTFFKEWDLKKAEQDDLTVRQSIQNPDRHPMIIADEAFYARGNPYPGGGKRKHCFLHIPATSPAVTADTNRFTFDMKYLHAHNSAATGNRLFIRFVALIPISALRKKMQDVKLAEKRTVQKLPLGIKVGSQNHPAGIVTITALMSTVFRGRFGQEGNE